MCPNDSIFHYGVYLDKQYACIYKDRDKGWYAKFPRTTDKPNFYFGTKRARVAIALILLNYTLR